MGKPVIAGTPGTRGGTSTSTKVYLGGRYALLLSGELSVDDLDDEELARGQLKDKNGRFQGRAPKVVPQQLVSAMRNELVKRAQNNLRQALLKSGIKTLTQLAENAVDESVRLRAAQAIIERTMGKVPDKVQIAAEDPVEALFRSILNDPEGLTGPQLPAVYEPSFEERLMLS